MFSISSLRLNFKHIISQLLHSYADWRIGATENEKRCYKSSDSILLTFDDSGTAQEVEGILSVLRQKQVRAMFFLIGDWAAKNPELVNKIKSAGHIIGNHTASHQILLSLSDSDIKHEIESANLTGPWLRPPQGRYNQRVRGVASSLGYSICYWSIDSRDWNGVSGAEMKHTIFNELHPGAVILFHLFGKHTVETLPAIIDGIRRRGYQLTDFNEPDWAIYK